jgi:thioredoxin 2
MMAPVYAQAARTLAPRVQVAKLDTERWPQVASPLQIRRITTLALFADGRDIARHSGAVDLGSLTRWVDAELALAV